MHTNADVFSYIERVHTNADVYSYIDPTGATVSHSGITRFQNLGNSCYLLAQTLSSPCLPSRNNAEVSNFATFSVYLTA